MARGIRSVLFAVTPRANAAVGLLMGLFFLCGGPISDWLRNSSRAGGVALVMASPLEGSRERFAMKAVLAMLRGRAWCRAALRGVRSGAPSGPVRCCAYAGVLTAAAAAAVLVRLHGWPSMLSKSSGAIAPVVQISELGYWG